MSVNDPLWTRDFWQRSFTQAIHAGAGATVGVLASEAFHTLGDVPWEGLLTTAVLGAVVSVLASVSSQPVPGTIPASFLPTSSLNR